MEKIKIPSIYGSSVGGLGVFNNGTINWQTCRDSFHSITSQKRYDGFFFSCSRGTIERVKKFVEQVQQIAKVDPKNYIVFKETTNKDILWVELNEWWNYPVRRSLLTALLRCGMKFSEDTGECFVKALNSQPYLKQTKNATERFLEGATAVKIKKNVFSGWQNQFANKTPEQVKKILVKLKKKES